MKKVIVSHMVQCAEQPTGTGRIPTRYELRPKGEALFHQFGVGYEEFEAGPGNYTTAIVEWPDGQVEAVLAEHIQFVVPHIAMYPVKVPDTSCQLTHKTSL